MLTSHDIIATQVVSELNLNASVEVVANTIIYSFVNLQPSLMMVCKPMLRWQNCVLLENYDVQEAEQA